MRTPWGGFLIGVVFLGVGVLDFVGPNRFPTGGSIWLIGGVVYISLAIAGRVRTGSWRKQKRGDRDSLPDSA